MPLSYRIPLARKTSNYAQRSYFKNNGTLPQQDTDCANELREQSFTCKGRSQFGSWKLLPSVEASVKGMSGRRRGEWCFAASALTLEIAEGESLSEGQVRKVLPDL